jgi:ribosome-associated toxin RatA of RatAB toxin-antitoxin module
MRKAAAMLMLLLWSAPALAGDELSALLARGPVTLVETKEDGRVKAVTSIAQLDAAPDVVWKKIVAFDDYTAWMPQCVQSTVTSTSGSTVTVDWSIDAPGPNVNFSATYELDEAARTVKGKWLAGALEGSTWEWQLVPSGSGTLVYRVTFSSAVSENWVLRQFDDPSHTLELGLNAATPIVELQALQKAVSE